MTIPRKYADVIKAWADGKMIQFNDGVKWRDFKHEDAIPDIFGGMEWRIKPELPKYRVAYMRAGDTFSVDNEEDAKDVEGRVSFVKWLTDWVEYETPNL